MGDTKCRNIFVHKSLNLQGASPPFVCVVYVGGKVILPRYVVVAVVLVTHL